MLGSGERGGGGEVDWTNYAGGENWLPVGLMDGFACFVLSVYVCV